MKFLVISVNILGFSLFLRFLKVVNIDYLPNRNVIIHVEIMFCLCLASVKPAKPD